MKTLLWIASLLALLMVSGCELREVAPAEMVSDTQSRPLGNEKGLTAAVGFDIGSLEVAADKSDKLYNLDMEYDKSSFQPEIQYETVGGNEGRLSFKLEGTHKFGLRSERRTNRIRLNLTESLPLQLEVRAGVGEARLSLSNLRLKRLELESGVGGSRISTYDPNPEICDRVRLRSGVGSMDAVGLGNLNFRELDFEGGVGGANLDLTGEWKQDANMRIEVGVGGVTVKMPREIGVRVEGEKHFLSGFQLDRFVKRDSDYYSENYEEAKIHVFIRVQTGVGGFKITWI
jgi:hypothetical protein